MPRLSCDEVRELIPELALGIISGDERADVLAHISTCRACRALVERSSASADALLLLGPEHEPRAGFENKVLSRMKGSAGPRWSRPLVGAAAALVAAVLAGSLALWVTAEERELGTHYREALEEANGDYFGVRAIVAPDGSKVGNLFLYTGHTDWVFAVLDEGVPPGRFRADVKTEHAGVIALGGFEVTDDDRTWGRAVSVDLREVTALRLHGPAGDIFVARFSESH